MKVKGLRWWVITLIALATIINYIDRQSLNVLWPAISVDLYPEKSDLERKEIYALISVIFVFSYAFGQAIFGKIFDWVGTRIGFALSIGVWSIATARALAQGIFNSGAAIGGIIAIPLIAYLSVHFTWNMIFILVGLTGLVWLIPWMILVKSPPKSHPWISDEERQYILSGQKNQDLDQDGDFDEGYNPNTSELLSRKQSWGVIIASAAIDPIWWLFVFWIPIYLSEVYGMDVKTIGIYGWVPYVGAMLGAWFGGLLAQNRIKAGWSVDRTRKLVITLGGIIMLPTLLAMSNPGEPVTAVILMAVILFGFQTAIGNVQTLPSDFYGGKTVGTLAGFAGMAAKLAAAGLTYLVPQLTAGGNYTPAFIIGAALALIAVGSIWLLCPKIEPLKPIGQG